MKKLLLFLLIIIFSEIIFGRMMSQRIEVFKYLRKLGVDSQYSVKDLDKMVAIRGKLKKVNNQIKMIDPTIFFGINYSDKLVKQAEVERVLLKNPMDHIVMIDKKRTKSLVLNRKIVKNINLNEKLDYIAIYIASDISGKNFKLIGIIEEHPKKKKVNSYHIEKTTDKAGRIVK